MTDNTSTDTSTEDTSGLKNKNADLVRRLKERDAEIERLNDEREQAIEDAKAETGSELDKANNELKKLRKQVETLTSERDTFATDLRTIRVDNEVKSAIAAGNVRPELVPAVEALLLRQAQYEDGLATINGKSIADHAKSFFTSKDGSYFVRAPESSGSGSTGNNGAAANAWTKAPTTASEWNAFDKLANEDPALRNSLADQWGMPQLKV